MQDSYQISGVIGATIHHESELFDRHHVLPTAGKYADGSLAYRPRIKETPWLVQCWPVSMPLTERTGGSFGKYRPPSRLPALVSCVISCSAVPNYLHHASGPVSLVAVEQPRDFAFDAAFFQTDNLAHTSLLVPVDLYTLDFLWRKVHTT